MLLRDVPRSDKFFWKDTIAEQIAQKVEDRDLSGYKRALPGNETLVMGLNEIAVEQGYGFFLHLPSRESWKTNDDESLLPLSRRPGSPGYVPICSQSTHTVHD